MAAIIDKNLKAALFALLIVALYAAFLYAGKTILGAEETFGRHMMNFSEPESAIINIFSIALAIACGAIVFLFLAKKSLKSARNQTKNASMP